MAKKNQAAETANLVAQAAGGGEADASQPGTQPGETADRSAGTVITSVPDVPATDSAPHLQASAQAAGVDAVAMLDALSGQIAASPLSGVLGEQLSVAAQAEAPVVTKRVQARVLVDGRFGRVNSLVSVTEEELEAGKDELCAHPASVAYAKSL